MPNPKPDGFFGSLWRSQPWNELSKRAATGASPARGARSTARPFDVTKLSAAPHPKRAALLHSAPRAPLQDEKNSVGHDLGKAPTRHTAVMTSNSPAAAGAAGAALITGATGFVGRALVAALRRGGRPVIALSRDARSAQSRLGQDVRVVARLDEIAPDTAIDSIVHLAGARVLGRRWTDARRRTLLASRAGVSDRLLALIQRLRQPPRVLVAASAVGFYGASPGGSFEPRDEASPPRPGQFQSDLCLAIENEARRAEALGVRVVLMRFGVILGRDDGAYPMQALAARLGMGAVLGSGRQPAPWIHLDDALGLVRFAIARADLAGAVNAVAPDTRPQADFAKALSRSFGRRVLLRFPSALLRLAMGEMGDLLLEGQNAVPAVAMRAGYVFVHSSLDEAMSDLAQKAP